MREKELLRVIPGLEAKKRATVSIMIVTAIATSFVLPDLQYDKRIKLRGALEQAHSQN